MHIALVRPPTITSKSSWMTGSLPPLGIAYIAGSLEENGHRVQVIDAIGEGIDQYSIVPEHQGIFRHGLTTNEIVNRIPKDVQLIGLSIMFSQDWPITRELIDAIGHEFPSIPIIAGGEHITGLTEFVLEDSPPLSVCVLGEGEETIVNLAEVLQEGGSLEDVGGIAYRKNKGICFNPPRERIRQIASIPKPAWHLIPLESYHKNKMMYGADLGVSMPIMASRGCPYRCTFCTSPQMWGTRWEARPVEDVLEEMAFYMDKYNATNFDFFDLTAIIRRDWVVEFAKQIVDRNLGITWQLPVGTRSEVLDEEVTRLLFESGCRSLGYAPESGSEETLGLIKKKIKTDRMLKSIQAAIKSQMNVKVGIILAFPFETYKHVLENYIFILKLIWAGIHELAVLNFCPFPGSELFEQLRKEGVVHLNDDYFVDLCRHCEIGTHKSFSSSISDRGLGLLTLSATAIFYGLSYLFRPQRLISIFGSLFSKQSNSRVRKAFRNLSINRQNFKNAETKAQLS